TQEFEADSLAAEILLASWWMRAKQRKLREDEVAIDGEMMAAGPCLFFAFDDLLSHSEEVLGIIPPVQLTHPPSQERLTAIRQFYLRVGGEGMLRTADDQLNWLGRIRDDVLREIKTLCNRV